MESFSSNKSATYYSGSQVGELINLPQKTGKHRVDAWEGQVVHILENGDVPEWGNETEVHMHESDLWIGLSGEVTFVVGGTLKEWSYRKNADSTDNLNEIKAPKIENGITYILHAGDVLEIPAGVPHTHFGTGKLFIIKIPSVK